MLALITALVSSATPGAPIAFGGQDHWVVVSRAGKELHRFSRIGGEVPLDVGVSPDGRLITFSAMDGKSGDRLLFVADADGRNLRRLGDEPGYYAAPSFTADGEWIVFAHQSHGGGNVGQHNDGGTAHLYKIKPDGTGFTLISANTGCHTQSSSLDAARVYVAHADCLGGMALALVTRSTNGKVVETALTPKDDWAAEPDLDARRGRLLYARRLYATVEIRILDLKTRRSRLVHQVPRNGEDKVSPSWTDDGNSILFQSNNTLFKLDLRGKSPTPLFNT